MFELVLKKKVILKFSLRIALCERVGDWFKCVLWRALNHFYMLNFSNWNNETTYADCIVNHPEDLTWVVIILENYYSNCLKQYQTGFCWVL